MRKGFTMSININTLTKAQLANMFDHTLLKAFATEADFEKLCRESDENGFKMVAINSYPVAMCKKFLKNSDVHVGAAISFPLGQMTVEAKVKETQDAIDSGADEIDYVLNVGKVKEGDFSYIENEMQTLTDLCKKQNILIKVIFENCYLTKEEITAVAKIAKKVKPDFIKTSTGFGTGGATVEDVTLMKSIVGDEVKVKAAGGIRSWETCKAMIEAGAERIGTSSSFAILEGFCKEKNEQ